MELGQKIKAARLELGLSQRQLCDGKITRNMLSQIENGAARPSMDTLRYLAGRLGKTLSYFLEDQAVTSSNMDCMTRARQAWRNGDSRGALEALAEFQEPDELFHEERQLLTLLSCLHQARQALEQERFPYARVMLSRAEQTPCAYLTDGLRRELAVLRGRAGEPVEQTSLCDEEALLLRAKQTEDPRRSLEILASSEDRQSCAWHYLAAEAYFRLKDYAAAVEHYRNAEEAFPEQVYPRLEHCCRELGDYKGAYEYACKQR